MHEGDQTGRPGRGERTQSLAQRAPGRLYRPRLASRPPSHTGAREILAPCRRHLAPAGRGCVRGGACRRIVLRGAARASGEDSVRVGTLSEIQEAPEDRAVVHAPSHGDRLWGRPCTAGRRCRDCDLWRPQEQGLRPREGSLNVPFGTNPHDGKSLIDGACAVG